MKVEKKGETLVITIPIEKRESGSGKSIVIASSNGNVTTSLMVDNKPLIVGVNCYISKKDKK